MVKSRSIICVLAVSKLSVSQRRNAVLKCVLQKHTFICSRNIVLFVCGSATYRPWNFRTFFHYFPLSVSDCFFSHLVLLRCFCFLAGCSFILLPSNLMVVGMREHPSMAHTLEGNTSILVVIQRVRLSDYNLSTETCRLNG